MATAFMFLITAINARILVFAIETLNIQPEAWWWKLISQLIFMAVMVLVANVLYRIMHYTMGIKPVRFLIRFTSLTTLPFWRRYKYLKNRYNFANSAKKK